MRVVIIHPYALHSGAVGGVGRVFELARFLARRHRVSVYAHASDQPGVDARAISEMGSLGIDQHLFARPAPGVGRKVSWWLDEAPYYVSRNRNPQLEAALADLDRRERIDVVHLELGYLAPLVNGMGPEAVRLLAEQETMSLAVERLQSVPFVQRSCYEVAAVTALAKARRFEAETLPRFDRIYGITPREAARLSEAARRDIPILPHIVDVDRFRPQPSDKRVPSVLFVGNFSHRPNAHALRWFVANVWGPNEALRRAASLNVAGPGLPDDLRRVVTSSGGRASGYVADLPACYAAATVVVNPIRSGGGMRGKVLEAFAAGRPVVSTSMGLEGIDAQSGQHCLVADDADQFAAHVAAYLDDAGLRRRHAAEARELVERHYHAPVVFSRLERAMEAELAARGRSTREGTAV